VLNKKERYTEACDMWSLGIISYILLTGKLPFFDSKDPKELRERFKKFKHNEE